MSKLIPAVIIIAIVQGLVPNAGVNEFGESRVDFEDCIEAVRRIINGRKAVRFTELAREIRAKVPMVRGENGYFDVPEYLIGALRKFA